MRNLVVKVYGVVGVVILAAMLGVIGAMDAEDEQAEEELYCQMVDEYIRSGGTNGWPPFRPETSCPEYRPKVVL